MRDLAAIFRDHLGRPGRQVGPATPSPAQVPAPAPTSPPPTPPAAEAPPKPRRTRPGICPGDPPTAVVDPESTRILVICELAGAAPRLGPDGRLTLGHPQRVSDDMRAAATLHRGDIEAILAYRRLLEITFPVTGEPPPDA
jgi:hypothetical protein